jgi:hypothetical protein
MPLVKADVHERIDVALATLVETPTSALLIGEMLQVQQIVRTRERYADQEFTADYLEALLAKI